MFRKGYPSMGGSNNQSMRVNEEDFCDELNNPENETKYSRNAENLKPVQEKMPGPNADDISVQRSHCGQRLRIRDARAFHQASGGSWACDNCRFFCRAEKRNDVKRPKFLMFHCFVCNEFEVCFECFHGDMCEDKEIKELFSEPSSDAKELEKGLCKKLEAKMDRRNTIWAVQDDFEVEVDGEEMVNLEKAFEGQSKSNVLAPVIVCRSFEYDGKRRNSAMHTV